MKNDLIFVTWIDATYDADGWQISEEGESLGLPPMEMETTGFLVEDDPNYITILQTYTPDGGYMNRFTIPRGCIKTINTIKKGSNPLAKITHPIFKLKK